MFAQTENTRSQRPRLLLGYADSAHAALRARVLRRRGWEVHLAGSGQEVRRLTGLLAPQVIVLDTDLADESGWLTAAKLLLERPEQKVFLVGGERSTISERFAAFLGAAGYLSRAECLPIIMDERVPVPA